MAGLSILDDVKNRLSVFKNMYDIIRIVDPMGKCTIDCPENGEGAEGSLCYDFWKRGSSCENCISMRAHLEKDTIHKLEYKDEKLFLIMASPIETGSKEYIVEILKDVTDNGLVPENDIKMDENIELLIKEMNEKVVTDELTKVYNRRYINERLPVDINNSILYGLPMSIIMADIDYFKKINDTYGHLIGDKVIVDFAQIIKESIRKSTDWVGRYGGEEFFIVLNNIHPNDAYRVCEKIRKNIEEHIFKYDEHEIKITSSFGLYSISNEKLNVDDYIELADRNLYKAKKGGRNRIVISKQAH